MVTAAAGGETMITHLAQVRGFLFLRTAREGNIFSGIRQSFCAPGVSLVSPLWTESPPPPEMASSGGHCSGQYASYRNALFWRKSRISQTGALTPEFEAKTYYSARFL